MALSLEGDDMVIQTDDALLERALYNLIDNGIKYNRPGGSLSIVLSEKGEDALIAVADTGVGMSDEAKAKAFDLFYRADPSRNHDGYGVGLALVREIARRLGGKIHIKDNPPTGTIFKFILPKKGRSKGETISTDKSRCIGICFFMSEIRAGNIKINIVFWNMLCFNKRERRAPLAFKEQKRRKIQSKNRRPLREAKSLPYGLRK